MTDKELKKLIETAENEPRLVAAAVSGLKDKVLDYKPSPEKWSVREILAHLADAEIIYGMRMRQMLADKDPVIGPIDQDAWAQNLGYRETSPPESVALFGLLRHANLRVLRRIKAEDTKKSAFHPEYKRQFTLEELLGRMAGHAENHLAQIEELKEAAKQSVVH
ncbi:MAG TPA: DinB family protein [Terriglobales bacterium]|nr:DinB family protein [Terriglobales bacterium]